MAQDPTAMAGFHEAGQEGVIPGVPMSKVHSGVRLGWRSQLVYALNIVEAVFEDRHIQHSGNHLFVILAHGDPVQVAGQGNEFGVLFFGCHY